MLLWIVHQTNHFMGMTNESLSYFHSIFSRWASVSWLIPGTIIPNSNFKRPVMASDAGFPRKSSAGSTNGNSYSCWWSFWKDRHFAICLVHKRFPALGASKKVISLGFFQSFRKMEDPKSFLWRICKSLQLLSLLLAENHVVGKSPSKKNTAKFQFHMLPLWNKRG